MPRLIVHGACHSLHLHRLKEDFPKRAIPGTMEGEKGEKGEKGAGKGYGKGYWGGHFSALERFLQPSPRENSLTTMV